MAQIEPNMLKSELLMPAGNLDKLKTAVLYGADAIYLGTPDMSLRTKSEFSLEQIREGIEFAHARGAFVLVVTDTHTCPALRHASARVVVPTESPNFFSSYVATMFFVETLMAMVAKRAGPAATERIADVETANLALGEVIGL